MKSKILRRFSVGGNEVDVTVGNQCTNFDEPFPWGILIYVWEV